MESADFSSQEKLDELLDRGKITDEDYLRLSKALKSGLKTGDGDASQPTTLRKLHKSWKNRQIGGVCGGVADYFGIDPSIVRIIAVVLFFIAPPIVLITYIALILFLPWDDEEAAIEPVRQDHPWRFAALGMLMITVVPWGFSQFLLPRLSEIYSPLGAALPAMTRIAVTVGDSYRYDLHRGGIPGGVILSLLIVAIATLFYLVCHNRKLRLAFGTLFFFFCALWMLMIIIGSYSGLFSLPKTIG